MPRNGQITESELQASLVRALKTQGWRVDFAWRSLHSPKGSPDLKAERDGHWLIAELKAGGRLKGGDWKNNPTPDQVEWLLRYWKLARAVTGRRLGIEIGVYVWRPDDLDAAYATIMGQRPLDPDGWLTAGGWLLKPSGKPLESDPILMDGEIGKHGYPNGVVDPTAILRSAPVIY